MSIESFYERHQQRHRTRVLMTIAYLAVIAIYLVWRVTVFNPEALTYSIVFYGAELLGLVSSAMTFFISWRIKPRQPVPAPPGLSVDVFVPTYNERLRMVRRTVKAAMDVSYPHETWLLDDGNRAEMKALADELGCHYLARENNIGAKPGNLNNALKHATADFVAVIGGRVGPALR